MTPLRQMRLENTNFDNWWNFCRLGPRAVASPLVSSSSRDFTIRRLARCLSKCIKQKHWLATQVVLDGNDLKSLNVGWLRDNVGIVGQEPGWVKCVKNYKNTFRSLHRDIISTFNMTFVS